jgi:penicillin-binding protein 2
MPLLQRAKEIQDYEDTRRLNTRIHVIHAFFGAVFVIYLMSFWYFQVVKSDYYRRLSDNNRLRRVTLMPLRGVITEAEHRVLANNRIAFNIRLDRDKVRDLEAFLPDLSRVLGMSVETLRNRLAKYRNRPAFEPVILKEDVDLAEAAYLESRRLEWPMLSVEVESRRSYLHGPLAAHALGYVGEVSDEQIKSEAAGGTYELGEIVGKAGVEREYESDLRGQKGWKQVVVNSLGREIEEVAEGRKPSPGRSLSLTLDLDLQEALETAFADEAGSAVFLDPATGDVLAMISRPAFDPNVFATRFSQDTWEGLVKDPRHPLQNRASLSKFAPGSVFKIVMAIAALEEGVATPARTDFCSGSWRFGDKTYQCWAIRKGGHGALAMREAIIHSCNVYFYRLGHELGIERIARWAHALGFGQPTRIDLPHEEGGTVPDPEWKQRAVPRDPAWHPGETISVSIGQGALEVTPIQMATFAATIGTGGMVRRPRLIRSREIREGVEEVNQDPKTIRAVPLHARTLQVVKDAMWGVVNELGTGARARIAGRDICAKTGTAQVYRASRDVDADKLPKDKRDHAWFVGFAPKDEPRIAWAVFVQNGGHGGTTAAPIARAVLERFFEKQDIRKGVGQIASAPPPR